MPLQPISEAIHEPNLLGQAGLKVKFEPENPFNPALIRFVFHALRSARDSTCSAQPDKMHYWHYSVTKGFHAALFSALFARSDFSSTALNILEALGGKLESFSSENEAISSLAIDYTPTETVILADSQVSEGEFVTEKNRILYRAIAVAIPKDENNPTGPHSIYLRSESDDTWIMFDDQACVYQTHIHHSEIADSVASAILYKRIGDFALNNFDLNMMLECSNIKYDPNAPILSAISRLMEVRYCFNDQEERQKCNKSSDRDLFKAFLKKSESMESMLTTIFQKWMIPVVMNQEDFKTLTAKGALYFPKNGQPVGSGTFTTEVPICSDNEFGHYRAIGMIVPKDESNPDGAQIVYLRLMSQANWIAFDDAAGTSRFGIPHDIIAHLKPTAIVYGMTNCGF